MTQAQPQTDSVVRNPSPAFHAAVKWALEEAKHSPDEVVRFAAYYIPIWVQYRPTPDQARAGGCEQCTYLGLWADRWPGYEKSPHGHIWLFEDGIRRMGGGLQQQALATLLHEFDHALQRDHVLEGMNRAKAELAAMAVRPSYGCCGQ